MKKLSKDYYKKIYYKQLVKKPFFAGKHLLYDSYPILFC
jgi:hypothetical protein